MKKLSEQLKDLSDRVAQAEMKVATAAQESKEMVEASIQRSKTEAEAKRASFKVNLLKDQESTAAQWKDLQETYNQKMQQIKDRIEAEKETREVKKANKRAEVAASYAEAAIYFAAIAIDEAEIAVLEAVAAQVYADSLSK